MFPQTPKTLLRKIADFANGDDREEWQEFVDLYTPSLRRFLRQVQGGMSEADLDDVIQDVFVRLVDVLRANAIDRSKGKFRSYLASMTRRILIDRYRESLVRPELGSDADAVDAVSSPRQREANNSFCASDTLSSVDPGALFDVRWRQAIRAAAVEHILTRTAISEQSKRIYRALQGLSPGFEGLSPREVAARFGVSYDVVKQVKSRIDRAISALEQRYSE